MDSTEKTFPIGDRASELMKAYSSSASPRSYELWFSYVLGSHPALREELKSRLANGGKLSLFDIETLYHAHVARSGPEGRTDEIGAGMLDKIEQVVGFLDVASGSTQRYDASLKALVADLDEGDHEAVRTVLEGLIAATKEMAVTNQTLDSRLRESRREIDDLRETLETVRLEGLIDPLTGIANRKHFEDALHRGCDRSHLKGEPLALIVIDVDHFKRFNDVYGHLTGDQVLRLVSAAMRESVLPNATLARFGGEEFAIIVPGLGLDESRACAENLRRNVEARELMKRSTGESLGRITISLGVALLRPGEHATSLLERADGCMYEAKRGGRNRTVTDADPSAATMIAAA